MNEWLGLFQSVLTQGLIYGVLALGVMVSYKVLDFADLSVDGTFPLGGAICAVLIVNGFNPWLALLIAFFGGAIAGFVTGWLHVKLKIAGLLSGILVMTALYSINLRVGNGSNIPIYNYDSFTSSPFTDASWANTSVGMWINENFTLLMLLLVIIGIKVLLDLFLKTRFGYLMKVTGDNEALVAVLGHDSGIVKMVGLSLSNAVVALSGAIAVSVNGYHDVNFGKGMVVLGLASVILGTIILKKTKASLTSMVIVGTIAYRLIVALAIKQGLDSKDLQLVTVLIFIGAIILNQVDINKYIKGNGNNVAHK